MRALVVTYHGETFNQAIEEALRQNPGFVGNVICLPAGMEWLLRGIKPLNHSEVENG
jgi:hypothetical protein